VPGPASGRAQVSGTTHPGLADTPVRMIMAFPAFVVCRHRRCAQTSQC
jgi:hypothetical protein